MEVLNHPQEQARGCRTQPCLLRHGQLLTRLQGTAPAPEALGTGRTQGPALGEGQQAVFEEMPLDCRRASQGLTAGELLPPASKNTPSLSLDSSHSVGKAGPAGVG